MNSLIIIFTVILLVCFSHVYAQQDGNATGEVGPSENETVSTAVTSNAPVPEETAGSLPVETSVPESGETGTSGPEGTAVTKPDESESPITEETEEPSSVNVTESEETTTTGIAAPGIHISSTSLVATSITALLVNERRGLI